MLADGPILRPSHLRRPECPDQHLRRNPRIPRHPQIFGRRRRHVHPGGHQKFGQSVRSRTDRGGQPVSQRRKPHRKSHPLQDHPVPHRGRTDLQRLQLDGAGPGRPHPGALHRRTETPAGHHPPAKYFRFGHHRGRYLPGHRGNL